MIVSMKNEDFRQSKCSDDRRDSGIDAQTSVESTASCSQLEKQQNTGIMNFSQSSCPSNILLDANKIDSIPSVKEMVRRREMMALKQNMSLSQAVPTKSSSEVETPDVKVKLIVQQFESCLQDEGKSDANNKYVLAKSEDRTRSCSRLPSFKHSLSSMNDSNSSYSDSCSSFINLLPNSVVAAATLDSQYNISKDTFDARSFEENPLHVNMHQFSKLNSLTSSLCLPTEESVVKFDNLSKASEKYTSGTLSHQNLQDLDQGNLSASRLTSKHSIENLSTDNSCFDSLVDNSLNPIYQIEVSENCKSSLNVRMSLDSGCNFVDRTSSTSWPLKTDNVSKLDDHNSSQGTSLYKLVKSLSEDNATPTKTRSSTSSDFARSFNSSGSRASSSPVETRSSKEFLSGICQQQSSKGSEETVTSKWILEKLRHSIPDLDIYYDPNEVCTVSKLEEVFKDLKNFISSKRNSDKNMISLFRENRSAMRLIRKQAKDLEDRYNLLQWKSVCTNRRVSELTSRHQEAMEVEDILNVRLANIQGELPDGVWLSPSRSLSGLLEAVLEGESLLLANRYKKVIAGLQQKLKFLSVETENNSNKNLSCQNHNLEISDHLAKEKEELLLLKEEISTLCSEIKKLSSERNHLLMANKTLHNELQQSHKKIAHFERDICSHICQHKKLKPPNSRDCNNPRHFLDIQEMRTRLQEQNHKIEQQNRIVDLLGALINATREVLHQQEHKTHNIPGVCKLLKMIEGEINPSSVVLEATSTSSLF